MNKAVSTSVVKLDLRTILDNYKKPEFWNKEWLIIDTKWISIIWRIKYIDCKKNFIESELVVKKINYRRKKIKVTSVYYWDTCECQSIPINNEEYTQTHFENNIFGALIRLLNKIERYLTTFYSEYEKAQEQDNEFEYTLRKIAEDFLDDNNVSNDDIREAYIDAYISKVDRDSFASKVLSNFQGKLLTNVYIYASVWFNREDDFNKYCKKENRKSIYYELKKEIDLIQTDEWNNSMKDKLEAI